MFLGKTMSPYREWIFYSCPSKVLLELGSCTCDSRRGFGGFFCGGISHISFNITGPKREDLSGWMLETVLLDPNKGITFKGMHYLHNTRGKPGCGAQRTSETEVFCSHLHVHQPNQSHLSLEMGLSSSSIIEQATMNKSLILIQTGWVHFPMFITLVLFLPPLPPLSSR